MNYPARGFRHYIETYERMVLFQPQTGFICDMGPRDVLAFAGPEVSLDTEPMADGSTRVRSKTHLVEIPVVSPEEAEVLEVMDARGCPVEALIIGSGKHTTWWEGCRLRLRPSRNGVPGLAPTVAALETTIYQPAIFQGRDLLAGIPWTGTVAYDTRQLEDAFVNPWGVAWAAGAGPAGEDLMIVSDPDSGLISVYDGFGGGGPDGDEAPVLLDRYPAPGQAPYGLTVDTSGAQERLIVLDYATQTVQRLAALSNFDGTTPAVEETVGLPTETAVDIALAGGDLFVVEQGLTNYQMVGFTSVVAASYQNGTYVSSIAAVDPADASAGFICADALNDAYNLRSGTFGYIRSLAGELVNPRGLALIGSGPGFFPGGDILYAQLGYGRIGRLSAQGDALGRTDLNSELPKYLMAGRNASGDLLEALGGYEGPLWEADRSGAKVASTGTLIQPPVRARIRVPLPGATLRLEGAAGTIRALDWNGVFLKAATGTASAPAELVLQDDFYDSLPGDYAIPVWEIEVEVTEATERPRLMVVDPGRSLGPRPGEITPSCRVRALYPAWMVSALQMTVQTTQPDTEVAFRRMTGGAGSIWYWGDVEPSDPAAFTVQVGDTPPTHTYDEAGTYEVAILNNQAFRSVTVFELHQEGAPLADVRYPTRLEDIGLARLTSARTISLYDCAGLLGTLEPDTLPDDGALQTVDLYEANVTGDWADLPRSVTRFNNYKGGIGGAMGDLPPAIEEVDTALGSPTTGSIDDLPDTLTVGLFGDASAVTGSSLPAGLTQLTLSNSDIVLQAADLPVGLTDLRMTNTPGLSGDIDNLPTAAEIYYLQNTNVSGFIQDFTAYPTLSQLWLNDCDQVDRVTLIDRAWQAIGQAGSPVNGLRLYLYRQNDPLNTSQASASDPGTTVGQQIDDLAAAGCTITHASPS